MENYILVFIAIILIVLALYPIIYTFKFRSTHKKYPISGTGMVLQIASIAGYAVLLYEKKTQYYTVALIIIALAFLIAVLLAEKKVGKLSTSLKDKIFAAYSQIMIPLYIVMFILWKLIKKEKK